MSWPPLLTRLSVLSLLILSIYGVFSGSDEPIISPLRGTRIEYAAVRLHTGNTIVFNLSVGVLSGLFIWFLVAWVPEQRRRAVIRANLTIKYRQFKEDVIQTLLWACADPYDADLPARLLDYREFQNFFKENSDKRWYAALNGLQDNPDYLKDIAVEMELLLAEVSYTLSSVSIPDDQVHSFFKRLSGNIQRLRSSSVFSHDQVKYLGNFLWGILARWDFINGQLQNDIVQDMIDRI